MATIARTILLPAIPESVRRAREWLAEIGAPLVGEKLADAQLVLSELVSNGVQHAGAERGRGLIEVRSKLTDDRLRVSVADPGPGYEPPQEVTLPAPDRPGGRGLFVVDRIADRWGVARGAGARTWFELDRRSGGPLGRAPQSTLRKGVGTAM